MVQNQLQLKKPKAIIFDVVGTLAKTSFIDKILLQYIKENIKVYLEENWDSSAVKMDLENLRALAKAEEGAPPIEEKDEKEKLIESVAIFVNYYAEKDKDADAMNLLKFHMWFDGLKRGRIEMPVYSDVANKLKIWSSQLSIRLFVFSNGWSEMSKRILSRTNHGDLSTLIEDYYDTELGELTETATFTKALALIKEPPETVVFLTKNAAQARAALNAGLNAILVMTHRRNIEKLDEEGRKIPRIRSFNDLEIVA